MMWINGPELVAIWDAYEKRNRRASSSYHANPLALSDILDCEEDRVCIRCKGPRPEHARYCGKCQVDHRRAQNRAAHARRQQRAAP